MLVFAAVCMAVLGAVYILGRERNKRKVLAFKALATLVADIIVIRYALEAGTFISWCFALGIFLYACADVLLELKFIAGIICFGAGHICLIVGMISDTLPGWVTVLVLMVQYGIALLIFRPCLKRLKKLRAPALIYVGLLCVMSAMTFTLAFAENAFAGWMRAAGSLCFVVSDGIIGWNFVHRKRSKWSGTVLMILYYLAVYLLAAAFFWVPGI